MTPLTHTHSGLSFDMLTASLVRPLDSAADMDQDGNVQQYVTVVVTQVAGDRGMTIAGKLTLLRIRLPELIYLRAK